MKKLRKFQYWVKKARNLEIVDIHVCCFARLFVEPSISHSGDNFPGCQNVFLREGAGG